jgi:hypothetical protein
MLAVLLKHFSGKSKAIGALFFHENENFELQCFEFPPVFREKLKIQRQKSPIKLFIPQKFRFSLPFCY